MRRNRFLALTAALTLGAALAVADLYKEPASAEPVYNPATMVDFKAVVEEVVVIPEFAVMGGVHLIMKHAGQKVDVYLGPRKLLQIFNVTFNEGDFVHVIGSRVPYGQTEVVLTKEAHRGRVSIYLRETDGTPVWKDWLKTS